MPAALQQKPSLAFQNIFELTAAGTCISRHLRERFHLAQVQRRNVFFCHWDTKGHQRSLIKQVCITNPKRFSRAPVIKIFERVAKCIQNKDHSIVPNIFSNASSSSNNWIHLPGLQVTWCLRLGVFIPPRTCRCVLGEPIAQNIEQILETSRWQA